MNQLDIKAHETKQHYSKRKYAKAKLKRIQNKKWATVRRVYKCKVCGEYCLTSKTK